MAAAHDVALDDPLQKWLPDSVHVAAKDGKPVTLMALAHHAAGLPRLPPNLGAAAPDNPYREYDLAKLFAFLDGWTPPWAPYDSVLYSNVGAGLLGVALARAAHTTYEDALFRRVLLPLGMSDTWIDLGPRTVGRVATPHDSAGQATSLWDFGALAGAGGVRSTAADMLTFLAHQMPLAHSPLRAVLDATHVPSPRGLDAQTGLGLGWLIAQGPVGPIYSLDGSTGGMRAFVGFDPKRGIGVVVLSNQADPIADIGQHLLDPSEPLAHPAPREERVK